MFTLKTIFVFSAANLPVDALVAKWTLGEIKMTAGAGKDVTKCVCNPTLASPFSLAMVDTEALKCAQNADFISEQCQAEVNVIAVSNQDDDAISCVLPYGVGFSETALADCGFKINQVSWTQCDVTPVDANATTFSEATKGYSQAFALMDQAADACRSSHWTEVIAANTTATDMTLSGTKKSEGIYSDVTVKPATPLDPALQWIMLQGKNVIVNLPTTGLNTVTTFQVSKTYTSASVSECKGNDGVMANLKFPTLALMAAMIPLFKL